MATKDINERVATEVMNRKAIKTGPTTSAMCNGSRVMNGSTYLIIEDLPVSEWGPRVESIPNFSGDISAAWDVVEKLDDKGISVRVSRVGSQWACWFKYQDTYHEYLVGFSRDETPMLAICNAALDICEKLGECK